MYAPLVSIIIPTYNRAHLIGETLESVLAQTYINWECIVVDDGSTDETDELLADYCEKDIRFYYYHRPIDRPKGANACRNYGFELSRGEYINWFDSDDVMVNTRLEKMLRVLINDSTIDYCICATQNFEGELEDNNLKKEIEAIESSNVYEDYILGRISILMISPIWRKSLLVKFKLFDEKLFQSQDLDLYSRIVFNNQRVEFLSEVLIYVRRINNSITTINRKMNLHTDSFLEVKKRIINRTPKNKKIRDFNIKLVLWLFRYNLSNKKYLDCEKCLAFAKVQSKREPLFFKINLMKITLFYYVFKFFGRGDTKFKYLLKL